MDEKAFEVSIVLANEPDAKVTRAFDEYLLDNLPNGVQLIERHRMPGHVYASADIHQILTDGGSVAAIATLVWTLYIKFVKVYRTKDSNTLVVFGIRREFETFYHHVIGGDITTEDQYQKSVEEVITRIEVSKHKKYSGHRRAGRHYSADGGD